MHGFLRRATTIWAVLLAVATVSAGCGTNGRSAQSSSAPPASSDKQASDAATEAYIFGYPLVTMEYTRRVLTNAAEPGGRAAPMGRFVRMREYPDAQFKAVTAPNADTLYTTAWFDVDKEPWVVSVPDMGDRYFLLPMLDGWTNVFASPGTRTTGGAAQTFAITGPHWHGTLPAGVTEYKSSTALVWLLGRIYCTGTPADYEAVHRLQDQITAVPLSSFGQPYSPPAATVDPVIDMKTPVREQVHALDGPAYFALLAELMKTNPPAAADSVMVAKLAEMGLVPGQAFDQGKLDPAAAASVAAAPKAAQQKIMASDKEAVAAGDLKFVNGWQYSTNLGDYGVNYLLRAYITAIGLGANLSKDAIYPKSEGPDAVAKYDGSSRYVLHFDKDKLPPVRGFWSLTMYDADYFLVDNPLNRYTLSRRNDLKTNPDGSVDLLIQADNPGPDREANWLPAPKGSFVLMLRLYWPTDTPPSLLDGSWLPPQVTKAD